MGKIFRYIALCTILTLAATLYFTPNPTSNHFEFTLKNGMRFVGIPNTKIPAVTHMIWYKVGAADEIAGKSGFAHLFEHVMFKRTSLLNAGEFSKMVSYYGGNDNAFTGQDYTAYYQTIPAQYLPMVMLMEAERMKNLQLDEATVIKERDIVLEERSQRTDNDPSALLMEQVKKSLYQTHPYGTPVIGWRDEINKLSVQDSVEFYKTYYNPNNATVVVSGDITKADLKQLAKRYFSRIPAGLSTNHLRHHITTMPPTVAKHRVDFSDQRVSTPEWVKLYQAPSAITGKTQHALPLVILANILGASDTGRLYQSLVIDQKIAVDASAYYNETHLGPTSFGIYVTPAKNVSFQQIETAVNNEINTLLTQQISAEELAHAQRALTADYIYAKDGIRTMAFIYGQVIASGMQANYIENWVENIKSITPQHIASAASDILSSENFVIGTLQNTEEE